MGYQRSFIDRLQKEAQPTEIDHTNTPWWAFVALALVQIPVTQGLASALGGGILGQLATIATGMHVTGFVISEVLQSCFLFDLTGEITFTACMLYSFASIEGEASHLQIACTTAALVWCIRLGGFLFWRILSRGSDWRFDKLIKGRGYNFFGWVCQGTWVWLQGMCLWALNNGSREWKSQSASEVPGLAVIGLAVWGAGFAIEVVADYQKTAWNSKIPSGAQKTWIATGLWRFSRHPNFFGEMLLWAGLALACGGGLSLKGCMVAAVSPLWSSFFLIFTSLMLLEKRLDQKFSEDPVYIEHCRITSVLIPWWPLPTKVA